jgi:ATP-binding cassette, subfamily G (WHITE), member 2, SNQ2
MVLENATQTRIRKLCYPSASSQTSPCSSAEFMLDVIGAGATATSEQDWHRIWNDSKKTTELQRELENIHAEGRNRPAVEAVSHTEFVTSWFYQAGQLLKRDAEAHWRDPNYLMAKIVLNAFGGLFIGFTFFHAKDSQQGTQNKLFVRLSVFLGGFFAHK